MENLYTHTYVNPCKNIVLLGLDLRAREARPGNMGSKKERREIPRNGVGNEAKRMSQKLQNPLISLCFVRKGAAQRAPKTTPKRTNFWSIPMSFSRAREARPGEMIN